MKSCQLDASIIPARLLLVEGGRRQPIRAECPDGEDLNARWWIHQELCWELFSRVDVVTKGSHHVLHAVLSSPAASPDQDGGHRHVETVPADLRPVLQLLLTGLPSQDTHRCSWGFRDTQTNKFLQQFNKESQFLHRQHPEVLQQAVSPLPAQADSARSQASTEQTQTCSQDWRRGACWSLQDNKRGPESGCRLSSWDGERS